MIIDAAMRGKNFKQFASSIDVHYDTLKHWSGQFPEFKEAYSRAKQEYEVYLMKVGMHGMLGKIPGFNTAVWIFWMKARSGWRDNDLAVDEEDGELEFIYE